MTLRQLPLHHASHGPPPPAARGEAEATAYAKINLALHVRERQANGYHRIETLFAFAEEGDRLRVEEWDDLTLTIDGPFAAGLSAGDDNLVLRAARLLRERAGVEAGARLFLEKNLPVAAGLGGGSADAAAAIGLLTRFWGIAFAAECGDLASSLGADVPACVLSRTCRGDGRGDELSLVEGLDVEGTPLLLVNPRLPVSTAAVFRGWDGMDRGPLVEWEAGRNDLEPPAMDLVPEIATVLAELRRHDPRLARMSGSGATCFALFEDEAERDRADAAIAAVHPHWWSLASRIR
jgi:4-diphosphocytidyl-2-C-methyl-D-erythritol kinase